MIGRFGIAFVLLCAGASAAGATETADNVRPRPLFPESSRLDGRPSDRFYLSGHFGPTAVSASRIVHQTGRNSFPSGSVTSEQPRASGIGFGGGASLTWWYTDYLGVELGRAEFQQSPALRGVDGRYHTLINRYSTGARFAVPMRWVQPYVFLGPTFRGVIVTGPNPAIQKAFVAGDMAIELDYFLGANIYLNRQSRLFVEYRDYPMGTVWTNRPNPSSTSQGYENRVKLEGFRPRALYVGYSFSPNIYRRQPTKGKTYATLGTAAALLYLGALGAAFGSYDGHQAAPQ